MAVLEATGLTKWYGARAAVENVSFELAAGEVFGFLGPNGAGKTTTIRMLTGLVRPDAGRVEIRGVDLARHFEKAIRHVGAIVEAPSLYRYLTGRENLALFARMLGRGAAARIDELGALVSLTGRLDDRVSAYSLGMRQRLAIAQALLGGPDVLILDEPANGLDPAGIREIRQLLRRLAREGGMAVLVSSHILAEMELLADRVAILHRGRVLAVERMDALLARGEAVRFVSAEPERLARFLRERFAPDARQRPGGAVTASLPGTRVSEAVAALAREGIPITEVAPERPRLEDLFLELTHGETVG